MKINRLLEITIILLNKKTITAKELADRFEVSTRTIYRDIDALSLAGVPVYTNKGSGGGISILEDYSLNRTLISEDESQSILFALKTLQATKYPDVEIMLDKIGGLFKNAESAEWIDIDFSPWSSSPNEDNKFDQIKRAILERKVIVFDYVNAEGKRAKRTIEPMKLSFKGQAWYLSGYCRYKEDVRIFRISRIKQLEVTAEEFKRRSFDFSENLKYIERPSSEIKLKLRFYKEAFYRVFDDFDENLISRQPDGSLLVDTVYPEDEWVYGYLMSFGCFVEVLEPVHIRKIIAERMKKALAYYEDNRIEE